MSTQRELMDDDYVLTEGSAWFTIKKFAVRIRETKDGIIVDIWKDGGELDHPISSAYALDSDCEEVA